MSSLEKSHQNTHTHFSQIGSNMNMPNIPTKYKDLIKQRLHSILDLIVKFEKGLSEYHGGVTYY